MLSAYKLDARFDKIKTPELIKILQTDTKNGLTENEARERLVFFGANELQKTKPLSWIPKLLSYFKNPLIVILLIASSISFITNNLQGAIIILIMALLSVGLDFQQEHRSSKAAAKIAEKLSLKSTVLRNGQKIITATKNLVPGDIIILSAGDIVPADGRLISADDLFINESVLTGESFPVEKIPAASELATLFSGTTVVSGYGQMLITSIGRYTEYGKIAEDLKKPSNPTPFEKGIKSFGFLIIKVIIFIVLIIFIINAFQKRDWVGSLIFSIAVAVGVTPELLPMIMSVNMTKGSVAMSKKGVIVKRLNAIPDFGSMDVLCTDKTGTLTEDKITMVKHLGPLGEESQKVLELAYLNGFFETGIKSILDKAILDFRKINVEAWKKIEEIPYDYFRRRSSIVVKSSDQVIMIAKGAPEEIFSICGDVKAASQKIYENLSRQGFRVLAVASKSTPEKPKYSKEDEVGMTFNGFIAFYDPPKISAKETVKFMKQYGVDVKILTGDSPLVAEKICNDLEIPNLGMVSGEKLDMEKMSFIELSSLVKNNNIFARFSPQQKEKIIKILKETGLTVGYLGDGVNDTPSLKAADVGISVDNAVDVAKETADIILMNKGLEELMEGVLLGRKTFGNTMKYLMMGLSSNFGNMFSMIGASLFLPFFPMLPGQILLNNFLYDASQLSIPSDKVDSEYLKKPKHWDMKFIKKFMVIFGPVSSIFDFITFFVLYKIWHLSGGAFQTGWFIESLATQTLVIYIIRTRKTPFFKSRPSIYLVATTSLAIIIGALITYSRVGYFFQFVPIAFKVLLSLALVVIIYLILVELTKYFFYKKIYRQQKI